ncbi:erythromycin esterase family protein [Streptomyces sp. NPDC001691]|uniref:erythromycin esterase family protein n=1 Tax=Streptomyces sp. NPDC001691 TaxID=3364600 RepID=UPI00369AEBD2
MDNDIAPLPAPAPSPAPAPGADTGPLSGAALDELAGRLAPAAVIVGIGESTRFSRETYGIRDQLFRRLVRHHGFRALAVQDSAGVGAELDRYVRGGGGTAAAALRHAWRPQRTEELAASLEWIRDFNRDHPHDPVRVFGVKPAQAGPDDYDAVRDFVRGAAPERLAELASHLDPISTAHQMDEHVQRARGVHPGRPFAEHARDALGLLMSVPGAEDSDGLLARMRLIVDFHEHSVAGRGSYAGEAEAWAGVIGAFHRRTGARVVYWDGIAHTASSETVLGMAPERGPQPTVGGLLRERFGSGYVSVAIGFHHGHLGTVDVPGPSRDLIDARLGEVALPAHWLDLRLEAVRARWEGPAKARVISGVYDPSRDAAGHLAVASLPEAFDVLVHVREVSAVHWLP